MPFVIVEHAGYEGEHDIGGKFDSYAEARDYVRKMYEPDEREQLHVEIAFDGPEGRTYEV